MLSDQDKWALSKARLEHAEDCMAEAENLLCSKQYRGASNRAYHAVFHAMRAVLALDGIVILL